MKSIEISKKTLHFHKRFTISYESVDTAEIILVKITDDDGLQGLGSASPDTEVTGETIESVYKILKKELTKDFFDLDIEKWREYHKKIKKTFRSFPSARAAVEEAVLNLFCKRHKMHMRDLFGKHREKCRTMITIGIEDKNSTIDEVKKRLLEGFKIIKLKCGLDVEGDIERIRAVSKILPDDCEMILDANQGYSLKEAEHLLESLKNEKIALIEQPVKSGDLEGLKKLNLLKSIPVVADESIVTVNDAIKLIKGNYVSGVNIKLTKCGGPLDFIKIYKLAKSLNKIIVIGCMYESNISLTTAANLALALPIDYVDLDSGNLDFHDDPATGGIKVEKGYITIEKELKLK
ncbi:MAG: dipeptide epimerase [Patescibacteria group bacterium]